MTAPLVVEQASDLVCDFVTACLHFSCEEADDTSRAAAQRVLTALAKGRELPRRINAQMTLFGAACAEMAITDHAATLRKLQALALREQKRTELVQEQNEIVVNAISQVGDDVAPLRGPGLAEAVYPSSALRHSHALVFLMSGPSAAQHVSKILEEAGWILVPTRGAASAHKLTLIGEGKVEVNLHHALLPWTPGAAERPLLADVMAVELLGYALYGQTALCQRWAVDLALLLKAKPVDAAAIADRLTAAGFAKAASDLLDFIRKITPPGAHQVLVTLDAIQRHLIHPTNSVEVERIMAVQRFTNISPRAQLLHLARNPGSSIQTIKSVLDARRRRAIAKKLKDRLPAADLHTKTRS